MNTLLVHQILACWLNLFSSYKGLNFQLTIITHAKNGIWIIHAGDIWIIHGGTRKITVCSSTFYGVAAKITVHTVKCTEAHCNFFSAIMNYRNAIFCVHIFEIYFSYNLVYSETKIYEMVFFFR